MCESKLGCVTVETEQKQLKKYILNSVTAVIRENKRNAAGNVAKRLWSCLRLSAGVVKTDYLLHVVWRRKVYSGQLCCKEINVSLSPAWVFSFWRSDDTKPVVCSGGPSWQGSICADYSITILGYTVALSLQDWT